MWKSCLTKPTTTLKCSVSSSIQSGQEGCGVEGRTQMIRGRRRIDRHVPATPHPPHPHHRVHAHSRYHLMCSAKWSVSNIKSSVQFKTDSQYHYHYNFLNLQVTTKWKKNCIISKSSKFKNFRGNVFQKRNNTVMRMSDCMQVLCPETRIQPQQEVMRTSAHVLLTIYLYTWTSHPS